MIFLWKSCIKRDSKPHDRRRHLTITPCLSMCDMISHLWEHNMCNLALIHSQEIMYKCMYKWNEMRRTSWGWWDEWDDTALQTQDSKFKPCGGGGGLRPSKLPPGHRGSSQYWIITSERGGNIFVFFKLKGQSGVRARDLRLPKQAALTTAPGAPPKCMYK